MWALTSIWVLTNSTNSAKSQTSTPQSNTVVEIPATARDQRAPTRRVLDFQFEILYSTPDKLNMHRCDQEDRDERADERMCQHSWKTSAES